MSFTIIPFYCIAGGIKKIIKEIQFTTRTYWSCNKITCIHWWHQLLHDDNQIFDAILSFMMQELYSNVAFAAHYKRFWLPCTQWHVVAVSTLHQAIDIGYTAAVLPDWWACVVYYVWKVKLCVAACSHYIDRQHSAFYIWHVIICMGLPHIFPNLISS